jgi:16S rRNA (guanine527-N7)-methyltransferase
VKRPDPDDCSLAVVVPEPPDIAATIFGGQLSQAQEYVRCLAGTGVDHGLIGPREVPRLWDRHVINCAVLTDLLPQSTEVLDLGSGAGLPGLTLAIRRPDLAVTLAEPLQRRVTWLEHTVAELELENVTVLRRRAQDLPQDGRWRYVTARAVAPLVTLAQWAVPLLQPNGELLAIKGRRAADELAELKGGPTSSTVAQTRIELLGAGSLPEPTTVVRLARRSAPASGGRSSRVGR